jgi:SAM-dependent methyltransferase
MTLDRTRRASFDSAARLYDEVRPRYPAQLIEDLLAWSALPPDGRILEIGCGPGTATLPLARRGYAMLCLELGRELAALAAENCRPFPRVRVQHVAFEDWLLQERAFDLLISAQAFHWIAPEIGYAKAAAALKETGTLALFWNLSPRPQTDFFRALAQVYQAKAPQLADSGKTKPLETQVELTLRDINASGLFGPVTLKRYPWIERYTASQYVKLLNTYSDHRRLSQKTQRALFAGVRELIEHFGGVMERPYVAVLYLARLKL